MTFGKSHSSEGGFTLIEVLVVIVVVSLLVGVIAEALIASYDSENNTSNRLSDSVNAQVTSEYFDRDVQGASLVTTTSNMSDITTTSALVSGQTYTSLNVTPLPTAIGKTVSVVLVSGSNHQVVTLSAAAALNATTISVASFIAGFSYPVSSRVTYIYQFDAPEVCGPTSGSFLVGLYHPPSSTTSASTTGLNVGYWATGSGSSTEIDRYSCSFDTTSFVALSPTKITMAIGPASSVTGTIRETIDSYADVNPTWLGYAAAAGWTPVVAHTVVEPSSGTLDLSTATSLPVGSTFGFTVGYTSTGTLCAPSTTNTLMASGSCTVNNPNITVASTTGTVKVKCTGFDATDFLGCSGGSGKAGTGATVTQASISGVQIALYEPSSNYRFNLVASPTTGATAAAIPGAKPPTLLTLGSGGINPISGGGSATCPDGNRDNICIESGGVVLDGGGTVQCNGQGPHGYIDVSSGNSVGTVSSPGSSSCNNLGIAKATPVPNPLSSLTCLSRSLATSALLGPATVSGGVSTPGLYTGTNKPSGKLAPGIYVVEDGIGTITGMAPDSGTTASYYKENSTLTDDPSSGVLIVNPGPETGSGCFNANGAALGGSVASLIPFDSSQSTFYFGNALLGDTWVWQDTLNSTTMSTTDGASAATSAGLVYIPSGTFSIGGSSSLTTGSMIAGSIQMNGTDLLILTGN